MRGFRLSEVVDHEPRTMSFRARIYLGTAGGRHLLVGITLLLTPWLYSAAAFIPIFNTLPLVAWGIIMTAEGILCGIAAATRRATLARVSIAGSATITLALATGLTIGIVAAWAVWFNTVGWDAAVHVILTAPQIYPADLLGLGPAPPSPFMPIVMLALTVKDFTVCAQPLRVPLEEWMPHRRRRVGES